MLVTQPNLFGVEQAERTSDDYYTPKWVFDALGLEFDLDVCAPPGGPPCVPARRWYTKEDDGLSQPWSGRVWMNPPYSDATPWVDRFLHHGDGVALLPMCKSYWVNSIFERASAIVIGEKGGEMHFIRPGSKPLRIWFPVFFAAMGDDCVKALRNLGPVRVLG